MITSVPISKAGKVKIILTPLYFSNAFRRCKILALSAFFLFVIG